MSEQGWRLSGPWIQEVTHANQSHSSRSRRCWPHGAELAAASWPGRFYASFGAGQPEMVTGQLVSGNYFQTLGTRSARGRLLGEDDDRTLGGSPVRLLRASPSGDETGTFLIAALVSAACLGRTASPWQALTPALWRRLATDLRPRELGMHVTEVGLDELDTALDAIVAGSARGRWVVRVGG